MSEASRANTDAGDDRKGASTSNGGLFAGLHITNSKTTSAPITTTNAYDQTPRLSNISSSERIISIHNDGVSKPLPAAPSLHSIDTMDSLYNNQFDDKNIAICSENQDVSIQEEESAVEKNEQIAQTEGDDLNNDDGNSEQDERTDTVREISSKEVVTAILLEGEEALNDAFGRQIEPRNFSSQQQLEPHVKEDEIEVATPVSQPTKVARTDSPEATISAESQKFSSRADRTEVADPGSPKQSERAEHGTTVTPPENPDPSVQLGRPQQQQHGLPGLGFVHKETPVPHPDICLAFLRKFVYKTEDKIPTTYGGTKTTSVWQYVISPLSGSGSISAREMKILFGPYLDMVLLIFDDEHVRNKQHTHLDESSRHNNNSNGELPDSTTYDGNSRSNSNTMTTTLNDSDISDDIRSRAASSMALFIHLFNVWGHASSAYLESKKDMKSLQMFTDLQASIFNTASNLVAYGCFDGVVIGFPPARLSNTPDSTTNAVLSQVPTETMEYFRAANMIVQSVFNSDLSVERNELFAIKLLLGTNCRVCSMGRDDSLIRGSYLLQSIRTLYHIYLTTESYSNKITARAALQQLVTNVFTKAVRCSSSANQNPGNEFPSDNHRDTFLVLRSLCKLSMRNVPTDYSQNSNGHNGNGTRTEIHSHFGLSTSASNETWDGTQTGSRGRLVSEDQAIGGRISSGLPPNHETAQLILTAAIHPALESKLLALELILYILLNVEFAANDFVQLCGVQFQSAIRNYLCVSLLKNCTADNTKVVSLSLRIFVPTVRHFRTILKAEIEAFVTNVFFVILDSKNSSAEHKRLVVKTFSEICSDPTTLAEIFLNYDCDLSAVDLFHRIVNTLSKLSRFGYNLQDDNNKGTGSISSILAIGASIASGPSEAQLEKERNDSRALRLDSMRALRQILASLHASIIEPIPEQQQLVTSNDHFTDPISTDTENLRVTTSDVSVESAHSDSNSAKQSLVEIYGSKKKRRAEESEAVLRFNQKPSAGIAYLAKCGHLDDKDPADVARYLLQNQNALDKTQIGEYLGREPDYQSGFSIAVLHEYVRLLDFKDLVFDDAIRYFLSGFRLPGEAQKIDRIMEKFAERFTEQNPDIFPTADAAFILSFSIIMLNTDLHNPAIKEERRMTKEGFIRNNRGICDGKDLPEDLLSAIFDRIKANPISLKEDDDAREKRKGDSKRVLNGLPSALSPASFFTSHYAELDRARESNFQKERDHIVRTTESFLKRRRHGGIGSQQQGQSYPNLSGNKDGIHSKSFRSSKSRQTSRFVLSSDSGLRDEYVSPMFDVTWGPALAAFSTAIESANGTTMSALLQIASDEELELAAENAAETIEVCLTGFRFAICTAGLCGNSIARDAYMLALSRFSQLGTGVLLEERHVRCVQTMLSLAREDGELLGGSWEHIFRALSEVNRYHQLFHLMARNDRAAARAAERRRTLLAAKEARRKERENRKAASEDSESITDVASSDGSWNQSEDDDSLTELGLETDDDYFMVFDDENMDAKSIDEANAKTIYNAVSETTIETIYERSSSLSAVAVKEFVIQLCHVSRSEIAVGNNSNNLNQVLYRQKHTLLDSRLPAGEFHHGQPNIYNLQKLVEVMHYNMHSRPRLLFADLWVTVADHLTNVALHSNTAVAMYAVDSFRQLSIQYLKREELEVFEFQRRFLKPLETVMARSDQSSTKELLLNCVGRVIHVFRTDETKASTPNDTTREKGGLRSGWVPILHILGLGGRDSDENIAQMSFKILSGEIDICIHSAGHQDVLLSDHFVETVQAIMMFIGGLHEEVSSLAMDQLIALASFLVDEFSCRSLGKRKSIDGQDSAKDKNTNQATKDTLELWWPLLLGLSQAVGDDRSVVRSKALDALFGIINKHFFSGDIIIPKESDLQTLQLIFRGVLTPILEFAETSSVQGGGQAPSLPEDFEFFLSSSDESKRPMPQSLDDDSPKDWIETTFDPFMDACVAMCLRSIKEYQNLTLIEEIFAILNSCLLSDSGTLAVRGLRRLEQFITSDLESNFLSDDVWATVSHMLRRCLSVRGLPSKPNLTSVGNDSDVAQEERKHKEEQYIQDLEEFVVQESMVTDRRYVGSNATMVVGLLLSSERFSISLRWRLFLTAGLGRGIIEWERVASILTPPNSPCPSNANRPPDYRETAMYGRKWMNRLLLQLASIKEIVEAPADADPKSNRFATGQKLVSDLTQGMLIAFVEKERLASKYRNSMPEKNIYVRLTTLVNELLAGYGNMDAGHLQKMFWINPVLLSSCIQSKNEEIRLMVQKLVSRTSAPKDPPGKQHSIPSAKLEDPPGMPPSKPKSTEGLEDELIPQSSLADELTYETINSESSGNVEP